MAKAVFTLAPLNAFQRLIRRWDVVHPYNAAQAVRVRGRPDRAAIAAAWQAAVTATGLGVVRVIGRRYHFEPASATPPVTSPTGPLADHRSAELNRSFADPGGIASSGGRGRSPATDCPTGPRGWLCSTPTRA